MRTIAALLICPLVVIAIVACASGRETTLRVAYVSTASAMDGLAAIEHAHADAIIAADEAAHKAPDAIRADVAAWRAKTDKAHTAIYTALTVIAAAAGLNDDASAALVAAPVAEATKAVAGLKAEAAAPVAVGSGQ